MTSHALESSDSSSSICRRAFECEDVNCDRVFRDKVSYEKHIQKRHGDLLKTPQKLCPLKFSHMSERSYGNGQLDIQTTPAEGTPPSTALFRNDITSSQEHFRDLEPHDRTEPLEHEDNFALRRLESSCEDCDGSSYPSDQRIINPCETSIQSSRECCFNEGFAHSACQENSQDHQCESCLTSTPECRHIPLTHAEFSHRPSLQEQGSVAAETYQLFSGYSDRYEDVFRNSSTKSPPLENLSKASQAVINFCSRKCMTLGESRDLFGLLCELESLRDGRSALPLTKDFKNEEAFSSYLRLARRRSVSRDNWKTALIHSRFGLNDTGVFRCVIDVMLDKIKEQGGVQSIIDFQIVERNGERVYSAPWNSEAMHEYQRSLSRRGKIVLFDVYSDGTCLSSSGTQSANLMRVRFSNVRGITDKWHEVGIVPTVQSHGNMVSAAAIRNEKVALWHRFAFLAFRDLIRKSHEGLQIDGVAVFPRLGMVVSDQVQERPTFGLKGHDSYYDCTHCLMPSKEAKLTTKNLPRKRRCISSHSDTESIDSNKTVSHTSTGQEIMPPHMQMSESAKRIKAIQLRSQSYPRRDVFNTVKNQLRIAQKRANPIGGAVNRSSIMYDSSRLEIRKAQDYLRGVSAGELPPVFAAVEGAGSFPYRLYSSIGFDKLHAWEHGVARMLTDDAFKLFDTAPQYNGYTKSKIVSIANQRIADLPRSAQFKRFGAYRRNANETHAGVTGKMRRELTCFLWSSVMGIPRSVSPDDDDFVQLLFMADLFQRKLMGVNMTRERSERTVNGIKEIAELGFQVGDKIVRLFGCIVNTKIHRVMRHVLDHLIDFGFIRKGATDDNETLHKRTKRAYNSTNKQSTSIAQQLLAARAMISTVDDNGNNDGFEADNPNIAQLLLTRTLSTQRSVQRRNEENFEQRTSNIMEIEGVLASSMNSLIETAACVEEAETIVENDVHISSNTKTWHVVKSTRFLATLPWVPNEKAYQIVYAGQDVFNQSRKDAIAYKIDNIVHVGIIQSLFAHYSDNKKKVALVRRLERVPAEVNNRKVVEVYGNTRYAYRKSRSDIQVDCVPTFRFIRKIILIVDPWVVSRIYGADVRFSEIPDTIYSRRYLAFFEVAGYQFSSIEESS